MPCLIYLQTEIVILVENVWLLLLCFGVDEVSEIVYAVLQAIIVVSKLLYALRGSYHWNSK